MGGFHSVVLFAIPPDHWLPLANVQNQGVTISDHFFKIRINHDFHSFNLQSHYQSFQD